MKSPQRFSAYIAQTILNFFLSRRLRSILRTKSSVIVAVLVATLFAQTSVIADDAEIYFFTSDGCPPCRQVEPMLKQLTQEGHRITKVDVNAYPRWVQKFNIRRTPTVVVIKDNREITRCQGLVDRSTVLNWLQQANRGDASDRKSGIESTTEAGLYAGADNYRTAPSGPRPQASANVSKISDTVLVGTRKPDNGAEQIAMDATVRLRVEDAEGFSFATGTVIHEHEGEWLVLTCGHVFRESQGRGKISVEYDFYNQKKTLPGSLLAYDAEARDVALVTVKANSPIQPVRLATSTLQVSNDSEIFSIGCDRGDDPTIRRSRIKSQAKYDGVKKYEIYGRPVVGRSGGGLFNSQGQLIGVCNAAAVDYDEGIYSSLDNIYWQLTKLDLKRLFDGPGVSPVRFASTNNAGATSLPNWDDSNGANPVARLPRTASTPRANLIPMAPIVHNTRPARLASSEASKFTRTPPMTSVSQQSSDTPGIRSEDMEVIVTVRSKSNPQKSDTIRLPNPSGQLLGYLESVTAQREGGSRRWAADSPQAMPRVAPPQQRGYDMRAQSRN